jgi:hypothetical protein
MGCHVSQATRAPGRVRQSVGGAGAAAHHHGDETAKAGGPDRRQSRTLWVDSIVLMPTPTIRPVCSRRAMTSDLAGRRRTGLSQNTSQPASTPCDQPGLARASVGLGLVGGDPDRLRPRSCRRRLTSSWSRLPRRTGGEARLSGPDPTGQRSPPVRAGPAGSPKRVATRAQEGHTQALLASC